MRMNYPITLSPLLCLLVFMSAPTRAADADSPDAATPNTAVPPHSPYHLPVGTAHGSAQSAAFGFNVRHDWGDIL